MNLSKRLIATVATVLIAASSVWADVSVNGYHRKDGTYVRPHMRSNPDGNFNNNWSTVGNVNPYTGKRGWIRNPPRNYGGSYSGSGSSYTTSSDAWAASDSISSQPTIKEREWKQYTPPKDITKSLSDADKTRHGELVSDLQDQGKRYCWRVYEPERLQEIKERMEVAARIRELGVTIEWFNETLASLLRIEERLVEADPADRQRLFATLR